VISLVSKIRKGFRFEETAHDPEPRMDITVSSTLCLCN
jgi:hypothetical protein